MEVQNGIYLLNSRNPNALQNIILGTVKQYNRQRGHYILSLNNGMRGILPVSKITMYDKSKNIQKLFVLQRGQRVLVWIEHSISEHVLAVSMKKLAIETFRALKPGDKIQSSKILQIKNGGLYIDLAQGVFSMLPNREICSMPFKEVRLRYTAGNTIDVTISSISYNAERRVYIQRKSVYPNYTQEQKASFVGKHLLTIVVKQLSEKEYICEINPNLYGILIVDDFTINSQLKIGEKVQVCVNNFNQKGLLLTDKF